jgi:hypothetical protein
MVRSSSRTISIPHVVVVAVVMICGPAHVSMVGATFDPRPLWPVGKTTAPASASASIDMIAAAPKVIAVALPGPATALAQKSFAFGYLEFDWDPNAPGGVPGFDSWPR